MIISDFKILERILKPNKIYNLYYFKPVRRFSLDSRSIAKGEAFVAIQGKHYDGHSFIQEAIGKGASFIVAEKYIPLKPKVPFFIVNDTYTALKSLVTYICKKKNPFIYCVTGSLGKTTTKEMLSFLLSSRFKVLKNKGTENNLLGVAKTCFSLQDEEIMILELGTNMPGEIESLAKLVVPDVGIITSINPVHLKGLGNIKGVFEEKTSLFKANPRMMAILNRDDPYLAKFSRPGKIYWFGKGRSNYLFARLLKRRRENVTFLIQDKYKLTISSYSQGFITNILAAISGAMIKGIALEELVNQTGRWENFLPLRMQMLQYKGFSILNDAYNANPHSFQVALTNLKRYPLKKVAVVGDMRELGKKSRYYHQLLAGQIMRGGFNYCLTLGEDTVYLNKKLRDSGYRGAFHFASHKAIAQFINKRIGPSLQRKKRYLIFLKGSRKMELEKVTKYLR
ncbi:MAG: UDP-N-acetylmuramoyl-tripeptide--D-alanyl-D-alanine ligase [Candidatus Omnitrophota bacterium]